MKIIIAFNEIKWDNSLKCNVMFRNNKKSSKNSKDSYKCPKKIYVMLKKNLIFLKYLFESGAFFVSNTLLRKRAFRK